MTEQEPRAITDFQHRQASHCESGSTANLCHFQGIDISEPMAFGIGAGLYFAYLFFLRAAHVRITSFRRSPGTVIRNTFRRLGIRYCRRSFWSRARAQRLLDQVLEQGQPVICQASLYWLPYFPLSMRLHFNAHHIVVYGRDDGHYVVSEPMLEEPKTLTRDDLERARFARGGMNPNGRMYWLRDKPEPRSVDLARPILQGIQDVCYQMLVPPVPILGVRGIRFLARDVMRWKQKLPEADVRENLSQIIYMQELVGSGGAGYRAMYAAFLSEAARVMQSEELAEATERMTAIVERWQDFGVLATRFVRGRPNPGDEYASMAEALRDLAAQEEALYRKLREYAKRREAVL